MSTTAAMPFLKKKEGTLLQYPTKNRRVLFDSDSDRDILFMIKEERDQLQTQSRAHPQQWKMSVGAFQTNEVGVVGLIFPDFNQFKNMTI